MPSSFDSVSDGAASDAITASVESRTSQEHVSVLGFNHVDNGLLALPGSSLK